MPGPTVTRMLITNLKEEGSALAISLAIQHHIGTERPDAFHGEFLFNFGCIVPILQVNPLRPMKGIAYGRLLFTSLTGIPLLASHVLIKLNQKGTFRIIEAHIQKLLADAMDIRL